MGEVVWPPPDGEQEPEETASPSQPTESGGQASAGGPKPGSNKDAAIGCLMLLAIIAAVGFFIFKGCSASDSPSSTAGGGAAGTSDDAALTADATAFISSNAAGSPESAVMTSFAVKSGVLWIYTSLPRSDVESAAAVCGQGSAWAYGDADALAANVWGVSVRASDGTGIVQRNGATDVCY